MTHFEFLADDDSDPRVPFVESLRKASAGAGSIVVYNDCFEYSRLDDLARWVPSHAAGIESIKRKMWDLLRIIRGNVYHPAFGGSFSLKAVLPAFVPGMTYETLEVSEGAAAGLAWARLIDPETPPKEKSRLKLALLKYCAQDTLGLVKLLEALRKYA